jgi:azurin
VFRIWSSLGIVITTMLFVLACGGGDPTPTEKPASTAKPAATEAPVVSPTPTTAPIASTGASTLDIGSRGDELYFDKDTLTVKSGEEILLTFTNNAGALQHNWVLVPVGTDLEISTAGVTAGADNYWIPDDSRIIASSILVEPGSSAKVKFTAPSAGSYTFVCTFPGHNFTMSGSLEVK